MQTRQNGPQTVFTTGDGYRLFGFRRRLHSSRPVRNAMARLDARTRTQAVATALRRVAH